VIQKKLLLYLVAGFILATILGTLSHEMGHYLANKILGYEARITYKSTVLIHTENSSARSAQERFVISLAGPLQTLLTGTIGLILLFSFQSSFNRKNLLRPKQWLLVFIALFWLRQVALLVMWLVAGVTDPSKRFASDEIKMSRYLDLPAGFLFWATGLAGAVVVGIVLFKFIPLSQRMTFVLAGIIGGIGGYLLWFGWVGKLLLP
jgi:hypothetical protein